MPDLPAIRVVPVTPEWRHALLQLRVTAPQRDFVSDIEPSLSDAENCPGSEPMAILYNEEPVGYYRIEAHAGSLADRDFDRPAVGLRSFFIDHRWQGRGLATQALSALTADLGVRYPDARMVVLLVNCRNLAALRLYLRACFVDTGELYHGGRSGPQHLLWRTLP
ncbi:GNAT family N-acetyltransferase [Dyella psychrodurans]|uniref:GNAT family N-acetyltransferase n=1 Tax=Dyella psychrodurans TaxID=1927960 RepID=A0A370WZ63_9GAMM|nr:GNAT family N-acetyltransferase [Dyella psychrodurans]RDS81320.1 GNAT family N-acetyltransferase [Dyella psychrodurans]